MAAGETVTRFAPSPTGFLHLGHAFAARFAWQRAREAGGRFLLRVEDIDTARCRAEYAEAILDDLYWLGLAPDAPPRVQSAHLPEYRAALDELAARELLYPCFCSRADIAASAGAQHAPDGAPLYPGTCRDLPDRTRQARLAAGVPHAWRLDVARAARRVPADLGYEEVGHGTVPCDPRRFGDVVLAGRGLPASYHLCVTHDDAAQGVTLVTRGEDLRAATDLHRLLQALMGWPAPRYAHHRVLRDAAGRRLAKRDASVSLRALRQAGATPEEIWRRIESPPTAEIAHSGEPALRDLHDGLAQPE